MIPFIDYLLLGGSGTEWSATDKSSSVTLYNGNLTADILSASAGGVRATPPRTSGKSYFEIFIYSNSGSNVRLIGIADGTYALNTGSFGDAHGAGASCTDTADGTGAHVVVSGVNVAAFAADISSGHYVGLAVDLGNRKLYMHRNGVYAGSMNPSAGTGGATYPMTGNIYPYVGQAGSDTVYIGNFTGPFQYSIPTGYSAWG